jgi:hypothetical protein
VQQAIRLVLQKFDELGSTRQVLLWLRREHVSVPVTRGGKHGRCTEWAPANYTRVHALVTNPFLAGAYVYGKSESRTTIVDGRIRRTSGHEVAVDQWQVMIPDHHPGYPPVRQRARPASITTRVRRDRRTPDSRLEPRAAQPIRNTCAIAAAIRREAVVKPRSG